MTVLVVLVVLLAQGQVQIVCLHSEIRINNLSNHVERNGWGPSVNFFMVESVCSLAVLNFSGMFSGLVS